MVGFNEIIGHEEIIRHLKNAMKTGKISIPIFFPDVRDPARSFWPPHMR